MPSDEVNFLGVHLSHLQSGTRGVYLQLSIEFVLDDIQSRGSVVEVHLLFGIHFQIEEKIRVVACEESIKFVSGWVSEWVGGLVNG